MIELLTQPWSWWFSGAMIAAIMFFLIFFGQSFGFSSNLKTICSAVGLGKTNKFFDFNWKSQMWNLVFLIGTILGGFLTKQFLSTDIPVHIAQSTIDDLSKLGIAAPESLQPAEIFSLEAMLSLKGFMILSFGGLMVGFGSRYANGCTSGHAISGLSDLQIPSLIAVIGFFAGGLIMTFLIMPLLFYSMKFIKFLLLGIVFGIVMTKSEAVSWFRIQEMFRFQAFHMYGIIGTAVTLGVSGVALIKKFKIRDYQGNQIVFSPKDKSVSRYLLGGSIFGLGWALSGACPGPMVVNVGYGYWAMAIVFFFALVGTYLYGVLKNKLPH